MQPAILLAAAATLLCTASAQRDPDAQRAGEWEITTTPVSVTGPGYSIDARTRPDMKPEVTRECFDGHSPRLGDRVGDGPCTVTRDGTKGPIVDVETTCPDGDRRPLINTIRGTRSPDRSDVRFTMTYNDNKRVVVSHVQSRRLGECPAKP